MNNSNNISYSEAKRIEIDSVYSNTSQGLIEITEDKLRLLLDEYMHSIDKCKEWQTPLAVLLTIVIALVTTDFKDALTLKKDTWSAIFIICAVLSGFWLINSLWKKISSMSIDDLVDKIKNIT